MDTSAHLEKSPQTQLLTESAPDVLTSPPKNVPFAECFDTSKKNGNGSAGALHAGIQAGGGAMGAWRAEHRSSGHDAGRGQQTLFSRALLVHIKAIHADTRGGYGWPRT